MDLKRQRGNIPFFITEKEGRFMKEIGQLDVTDNKRLVLSLGEYQGDA